MDPSLGAIKHVHIAFRIAMMRLSGKCSSLFYLCISIGLSIEPERRKNYCAGIYLRLSENSWTKTVHQMTFAEHTVPGHFGLLLLLALVLGLSAVRLLCWM